MPTLATELMSRSYPGRVCVAVRTSSGTYRFVYALTGRSEASRARSLQALATSVEVVDTREAGTHDELRHYVAAIRVGNWTVIGNGDHVHSFANDLRGSVADSRAAVEAAWARHSYEPDPPIFTPRIWVAARQHPSDELGLWAGIVTRSHSGSASHRVWRFDDLAPGSGWLLTTYSGFVDQPRPAEEVVQVTTDAGADEVIDEVWNALDPGLRVAAIQIDPASTDFHEAALRGTGQQ